MNSPLLVVGVGRSGTSLVQAMLHAHPEVAFLPETHFFRRYVAPPTRRLVWRTRGPRHLRDRLASDTDFARADISPEELLSPFLGSRLFAPSRVYLRLLKLSRRRFGTGRIGDKDPRLVDFLPVVQRFVPGVRVVHVIRDPRDVLVSRRKAAWSRGRSDLSHILTYRAQMERGRAAGSRCLGDRYLEIRYEDLLRAPKETVDGLCRFVGLDFHPATLSFGDDARDLVGEDEWEWKKGITGSLRRDNIGNWKGEIAPTTLRLVERICIDPFDDLDYAPTEAGRRDNGPMDRMALAVVGTAAGLVARCYPIRTLFN